MESDRRANRKSGGHAGGTWARQSEPEADVQPERRAKALVFMAQAFVSRPKVLLLDEPTSALDLRHQLVVMDLAGNTRGKTGRLHFLSCMISCWRRDTAAVCSCFTRGGSRPLIRPNGCCTRHLLGDVYDVEASVERTRPGFLNVIPVRPL